MAKADMYLKYLREEGYSPVVDRDGDIQFKFEGLVLCLFVAEDDPQYFRLTLPAFFIIQNEEERHKVLAAASEVMASIKAGKMFVVGDKAWISVELLIDPIEDFTKIFRRALLIVRMCVKRFQERMAAIVV